MGGATAPVHQVHSERRGLITSVAVIQPAFRRHVHSGIETTAFLICVLIMHAARQLTRVLGVPDGAVFPLFIDHQVTPEVQSVVDVAEAELNVVVL